MFIVENIVGSIFWGLLVALVMSVLVFFVCTLFSRKNVQSPISILVIAVYFLFATATGALIAGGYYTKGYVEDMGDYIASITDKTTDIAFSDADFNDLKDMITDEYPGTKPILEHFDANEFTRKSSVGRSVSDFLVDEVNDTIDEYIERCLKWLLFGTLIAVLLATVAARHGGGVGHRLSSSDYDHYGFDNDTSSSGYY